MRHNEILETLQNLINRKPKQKELSEATGIPINTIGNRAVRNSQYSVEEIQRISDYFHTDILREKWVDNQFSKGELAEVLSSGEEEIMADYFPDVFGSCGNGTFVLSECKEKIAVPKKIIETFSSIKKYSVINAYGDSMLPYIHDRDMLVVEHYEGEQIRDNRIYVFRFGDKIFVKRLVLNINQLVIKSDNTLYQPITIELSGNADIQIIGQIVGLMRSTT